MCAVIGCYSKTKVNLDNFRKILLQSKIRGLHATGIAWNDNGVLKHRVISEPANYINIDDINTNMLIAHNRYSTSDLNYNQPIISSNLAIVHNGVISQESPSTWEKTYGYKFETKNDSEIILRSWENNKHPLNLNGSMAVVVLDLREKPKMHFFRNEQRPLYYVKNDDDIFIASTYDILYRSNLYYKINKTDSCYDYHIDNSLIFYKKIRESVQDLQQ